MLGCFKFNFVLQGPPESFRIRAVKQVLILHSAPDLKFDRVSKSQSEITLI